MGQFSTLGFLILPDVIFSKRKSFHFMKSLQLGIEATWGGGHSGKMKMQWIWWQNSIFVSICLHNMICVCNYIRFKKLLNMIGRQLAVLSLNTVLIWWVTRAQPKIWRKIQTNWRWYITSITRFLDVCMHHYPADTFFVRCLGVFPT